MKKQKIYQLTICALMTALMCILGPMSIPIGPIPISMTNFIILLSVYLLGMKGGTMSCGVYLLLGAVGLPVFSGYQGGIGKLAGSTGGYLAGFILMALVSGFVMERFYAHTWIMILGMIVAVLVDYFAGTVWFVFQMKCDVWYALTTCVFPFFVIDMIKILIVAAVGKMIRSTLIKAGLLSIAGSAVLRNTV